MKKYITINNGGSTIRITLKLFIIFIGLMILTSCGKPVTSTTSMLTVIDKGHSNEEYWIKAYDHNNESIEEAFVIVVEKEMAWHLIEENREYFSTYSKEGDQPWILNQIEHIEILPE